MIGGDDLFLEGQPGIDDIDFIVRFFRHAWPTAIFEGAPDYEAIPIDSPKLFPVKWRSELFLYRDQESYDSWKRDGLTTDNGSAVVYVIVEEELMSFVVDDRSSPSGRLVLELIEALQQNRRLIRRAA